MKNTTVKIGYILLDNPEVLERVKSYSANPQNELDYTTHAVKTFVLVAIDYNICIDVIDAPIWDDPTQSNIDYTNSLFPNMANYEADFLVKMSVIRKAREFFINNFDSCSDVSKGRFSTYKRPSLGKITPLENLSFEISHKSKRSLEKSIEEKLISLANGISLEWETSLEGVVKYFENLKK